MQSKLERDTGQSLFLYLSVCPSGLHCLPDRLRACTACVMDCLLQSKLEQDTGQSLFVGLSLADTIATCLRLGHSKAAATLRR
jgi:hypothetical protein